MFEEFKAMLVEQCNINADDVTEDANLVNDLGINSLELADLVLLCEEKFDIIIDDEDIHNFTTVGDIANFLEKKTNS